MVIERASAAPWQRNCVNLPSVPRGAVGGVVVAIRCRDGRRVARRSDDGSLAFRGVAFVRAARAAWSISLRTQR
ncbi:hypothetical protein MTX35_25310, partial [Rhodococcus sp. ARC_M12]|uniref:hypothetical protein n=1 Tax=Rhodococcus sp. ARC_M12 TaxID=2928854 RepID=UPI001FB1B1F4